MAFMGPSGSSCYLQTSVSLTSLSTALVSEFKDKFSAEAAGPNSYAARAEVGNSHASFSERVTATSSAAACPTQGIHRCMSSESSLATMQGVRDFIGRGQANPAARSTSPELLQSADWSHMVDTSSMHFSDPVVGMTMPVTSVGSPSASTGREVARMHEIPMGRGLGSSSHPSHPSNGAPPQLASSSSPQQQHHLAGSGMLRNKSWSALDISNKMDAATKSSLNSLQTGTGLATSHCLAQFTSDPGFAERAAKFSSFGNGTYNSQPYLPEGKGGRRSGQSLDSDDKLSRSSSCSRLPNMGTTANASANVGSHPAAVESKSPNQDALRDGNPTHDMEHDHAASLDLETQLKQNDQIKRVEQRMQVDCSPMEGVAEAGGGSGAGLSTEFDTGDELENSSYSSENARGDIIGRSDSLGKRKNSLKSSCKDHASASSMAPQAGGCDPKLQDSEEATAKRHKSEGDSVREEGTKGNKTDRSSSENSGETSPTWMKGSSKPPEPPKQDYIHVRARRGQATDSHSLAERVRREKISERMKFLQDLVPGCNKVTGKAVMLDEIINYVQSLQRQVEFLSMKLAAVNPRLDFNIDTLFATEMQSQLSAPAMMLGPDMGMPPYGHRQAPSMQMGGHPASLDFRPLEAVASEASHIRRTMSAPVTAPLSCLDIFGDSCMSQTSSVWDGELQSMVNYMGFGQGRPTDVLPQLPLHCQLPAGHMKVEL